mmetsp:Transcript_6057/g.14591  ORF Transcript_6057/g.14591 Transcript_6057/m.14591 type:complete len:232 (+) Transcript_6057:11173-11868(+)
MFSGLMESDEEAPLALTATKGAFCSAGGFWSLKLNVYLVPASHLMVVLWSSETTRVPVLFFHTAELSSTSVPGWTILRATLSSVTEPMRPTKVILVGRFMATLVSSVTVMVLTSVVKGVDCTTSLVMNLGGSMSRGSSVTLAVRSIVHLGMGMGSGQVPAFAAQIEMSGAFCSVRAFLTVNLKVYWVPAVVVVAILSDSFLRLLSQVAVWMMGLSSTAWTDPASAPTNPER